MREVRPPRLRLKLVAGLISTRRSSSWGAERATRTPRHPPKDSATRITCSAGRVGAGATGVWQQLLDTHLVVVGYAVAHVLDERNGLLFQRLPARPVVCGCVHNPASSSERAQGLVHLGLCLQPLSGAPHVITCLHQARRLWSQGVASAISTCMARRLRGAQLTASVRGHCRAAKQKQHPPGM